MKLDLNCTVTYFNNFLDKNTSKMLYQELVEQYHVGQLRKVQVAGKIKTLSTGKVMFIDKNLKTGNKLPEKQWGRTFVWFPNLIEIKKRIEQLTNMTFNVCVCIYYPDGNTGVAYHSDLVAFGDTTIVPSLSIGEERVFSLREKSTLKEHHIVLAEGSLIIMGENCQDRYEHALPNDPIYKNGRINLTFRQYGFPAKKVAF